MRTEVVFLTKFSIPIFEDIMIGFGHSFFPIDRPMILEYTSKREFQDLCSKFCLRGCKWGYGCRYK
jgi:hypothetical protein